MQRATFETAGPDQPSPGTAATGAAATGAASGTRRVRRLSVAIPPLVTLAVMLWGISGSSYWRDEAATLSAVHRPLPDLFRLLGFVDGVHGTYYTIVWLTVRLFGYGELAVRLPSALAMAAAAAAVAVLGRRLISPWAGLAAGLLFAVLPTVSWYGQDARSPALVTALAAGATYLFVRVLDATGRERRRWLAGYALGLALLGLANVFGLLLIAAHAATLAARWRRDGGSASAAWRALAIRWLAAVAAALVLISPLLALAWKEHWQIGWTPKPGLNTLRTLLGLVGSPALVIVAVLVLLAGVAASFGFGLDALTGTARPAGARTTGGTDRPSSADRPAGRDAARRWSRELTELCLPWLVLPPVILLAVSLVKPVYEFRYVVFCLPAVALLLGAALVALGRAGAVAGLAAIVVIGLPAQLTVRGPAGHGDNSRALEHVVAANEHPGDVVYYLDDGAGTFAYAYSYGLNRLPVVAQKQTPIQASTLTGRLLRGDQVRAKLAHVPRLWVVGLNRLSQQKAGRMAALNYLIEGQSFRLERTWQFSGLWLELYVHQAG